MVSFLSVARSEKEGGGREDLDVGEDGDDAALFHVDARHLHLGRSRSNIERSDDLLHFTNIFTVAHQPLSHL